MKPTRNHSLGCYCINRWMWEQVKCFFSVWEYITLCCWASAMGGPRRYKGKWPHYDKTLKTQGVLIHSETVVLIWAYFLTRMNMSLQCAEQHITMVNKVQDLNLFFLKAKLIAVVRAFDTSRKDHWYCILSYDFCLCHQSPLANAEWCCLHTVSYFDYKWKKMFSSPS